jgi:hypothetical protein
MTAEGERETATAERMQALDEAEASISSTEKAVRIRPSGSLARHREAIHELGCRIVAQALEKK